MRQLATIAQLAAEIDFDKWFALVEAPDLRGWTELQRSRPLLDRHRSGTEVFVGKVECFDAHPCLLQPRRRQVRRARGADISDRLPVPQSGQSRYVNRMNAASISKIERLFDADFDLFGYEKHSS